MSRITAHGAQQRTRIVQLRTQNLAWAEIAAEVGLSMSRAHALYQDALTRMPIASIDEHRAQDGAVIEKAIAALMTIATDAKSGLRHRIDSWLAIERFLDRRARLFGLDAPLKHEVLTISSLDQQIMELEAELERTPND
jgi:hypothetical protein